MTEFSTEVQERLDQAGTILLPKGDNRQPTTELLLANGLTVPEFDGRCLHRPGRGQDLCPGARQRHARVAR